MDNLTDQTWTELVQRVVEEGAFMLAESSEVKLGGDDVLEARLDFEGARRGCLLLQGHADMGAELASNLLGVDPEDSDASAQAEDALGEVLNMIAGAFVASFFEPGTVRFGVPTVVSPGRAISPDFAPAVSAGLVSIESDRALVATVMFCR